METPRPPHERLEVHVNQSFVVGSEPRPLSWGAWGVLLFTAVVISCTALALALVPVESVLDAAATQAGGDSLSVENARQVATSAALWGFLAGALVAVLYAKIYIDRKYRP